MSTVLVLEIVQLIQYNGWMYCTVVPAFAETRLESAHDASINIKF